MLPENSSSRGFYQKNAKYVEVCGNHKKPSEMAKQFKIILASGHIAQVVRLGTGPILGSNVS